MNNQIGKVNGLFCVSGIFTKKNIITRLVISLIILFFSLMLTNRAVADNWAWWGVVIFILISLILIQYIIDLLRRKTGVRFKGFLMTEKGLHEGLLFAETPDIKKLLSHRSSGKLIQTEIVPRKWDLIGKEMLFSIEQPFRVLITITNQFTSDIPEDWHISKIQLYRSDKMIFERSLTLRSNHLCTIEDNQAIFHFSYDGKKPGEKLLKQISMIGEKLNKYGISGPDDVMLKIIPEKSSFARSAAFGAIGVAIASFRDEKKKKNLRKDLEEGKLKIINSEVDKELFDMIEKLHWGVMI